MSRARARVIAQARRRPDPLPWLPWLLLLGLLMAGSAAMAQTSASPGAGLPLAPPTQPAPGGTSGGAPDTPGGSTRNGVATPVPNPDPGINKGAPVPSTGMPVIVPPGSPGGNTTVVPK